MKELWHDFRLCISLTWPPASSQSIPKSGFFLTCWTIYCSNSFSQKDSEENLRGTYYQIIKIYSPSWFKHMRALSYNLFVKHILCQQAFRTVSQSTNHAEDGTSSLWPTCQPRFRQNLFVCPIYFELRLFWECMKGSGRTQFFLTK